MAFYCRSSITACSVLNNCYYRYSTNITRLKLTHGDLICRKQAKNFSQYATKENDLSYLPYENLIKERKLQAHKYILVETGPNTSLAELENHCCRFGTITQVHHYKTHKNIEDNYFLLEFQQAHSVNLLLHYTTAIYGAMQATIKTPIFRFRSSYHSKNFSSDPTLKMVNEMSLVDDQIIISDIMSTDSISDQITVLYNATKLSELETKLRFYTICQLERCFSNLIPDINVQPFGSSVNGFGNHCCDLDLVAVIEENQKGFVEKHKMALQGKSFKLEEKTDIKDFLWILSKMLQFFMPGVGKVQQILEARVPIIKFAYSQTNIECDLTIQNISGVYMSELLYLYGQIDNRVRPLIFTIRKWAEKAELTHKNPGPWITNFSLSLLVLFYLQQKKILPTVHQLKAYASHVDIRSTTEGTDYTFVRNLKKIPSASWQSNNHDTLETLLYDFFEYYNKFDFNTNSICIRKGIVSPKQRKSTLYINNPFNNTMNVSKNVTMTELQKIRISIQTALLTFDENNSSRGLISLLCLSKHIARRKTTVDTSSLSKSKFQSNSTLIENVKNQDIEVPASGCR